MKLSSTCLEKVSRLQTLDVRVDFNNPGIYQEESTASRKQPRVLLCFAGDSFLMQMLAEPIRDKAVLEHCS